MQLNIGLGLAMLTNSKPSSKVLSPEISVLLVNYHSKRQLAACLDSLKSSTVPYEAIVIDNDRSNIGYGAGINQAAKQAHGDYLFVLNPDTLVFPDTLKNLVDFLKYHSRSGIVAPLLLDGQGKVYPLQGTAELTPIAAILSLSFLNKFFPTNPISRQYWLADWAKDSPRQVAVVPGTAFLIRRSLFEQLNGFDPNFFLYFEESDLCLRASHLGSEIWITSQTKLIHFWKGSTPDSPEIKNIFAHSRFYYFRKHFGLLSALLVELFCRFSIRRMLESN